MDASSSEEEGKFFRAGPHTEYEHAVLYVCMYVYVCMKYFLKPLMKVLFYLNIQCVIHVCVYVCVCMYVHMYCMYVCMSMGLLCVTTTASCSWDCLTLLYQRPGENGLEVTSHALTWNPVEPIEGFITVNIGLLYTIYYHLKNNFFFTGTKATC